MWLSFLHLQTTTPPPKPRPHQNVSKTKTTNSDFLSPPSEREEAPKPIPMAAAAASLSANQGLLRTSFYGGWGNSISGDDMLPRQQQQAKVSRKPIRVQPMMKNVNEGKGLFAPLVVVTRDIVGKKRFNQLRGKAIALHSQVITEFCKSIGADAKQRQGLIRLAKKNGERLGFLA